MCGMDRPAGARYLWRTEVKFGNWLKRRRWIMRRRARVAAASNASAFHAELFSPVDLSSFLPSSLYRTRGFQWTECSESIRATRNNFQPRGKQIIIPLFCMIRYFAFRFRFTFPGSDIKRNMGIVNVIGIKKFTLNFVPVARIKVRNFWCQPNGVDGVKRVKLLLCALRAVSVSDSPKNRRNVIPSIALVSFG